LTEIRSTIEEIFQKFFARLWITGQVQGIGIYSRCFGFSFLFYFYFCIWEWAWRTLHSGKGHDMSTGGLATFQERFHSEKQSIAPGGIGNMGRGIDMAFLRACSLIVQFTHLHFGLRLPCLALIMDYIYFMIQRHWRLAEYLGGIWRVFGWLWQRTDCWTFIINFIIILLLTSFIHGKGSILSCFLISIYYAFQLYNTCLPQPFPHRCQPLVFRRFSSLLIYLASVCFR
jgi:hypothetical protein